MGAGIRVKNVTMKMMGMTRNPVTAALLRRMFQFTLEQKLSSSISASTLGCETLSQDGLASEAKEFLKKLTLTVRSIVRFLEQRVPVMKLCLEALSSLKNNPRGLLENAADCLGKDLESGDEVLTALRNGDPDDHFLDIGRTMASGFIQLGQRGCAQVFVKYLAGHSTDNPEAKNKSGQCAKTRMQV
ncbi:hypothetical protein Btru_070642 [Bulinus truncatus]|nr:hypothetical protein Btru_070642 [Bulinus truncatus]